MPNPRPSDPRARRRRWARAGALPGAPALCRLRQRAGAISSPLLGCSVHTSQVAARIPSPACWGRWREAPDGVWPAATTPDGCTNVTANLRSKRPAFHTPSVAFGDTFPASRRRGRPAAACRLDDLCELRSLVGEDEGGGRTGPRKLCFDPSSEMAARPPTPARPHHRASGRTPVSRRAMGGGSAPNCHKIDFARLPLIGRPSP